MSCVSDRGVWHMEIGRRTFCKILLATGGFFLARFLKPLYADIRKRNAYIGSAGYPGKIMPLDREKIRRLSGWAG
jgi:hypothetical protein